MRFMVMHRVNDTMESGAPPAPEIVQGMGELVQSSLKDGVFENGAGLHRSALRVRVRSTNSQCTVTRGPFDGDDQLVCATSMVRARSMDEAVQLGRRMAEMLGEVDIEVGPVVEPWDLGLVPPPEGNPPGRFLLLEKTTAEAERSVPASLHQARRDAFLQELRESEILLFCERLAPSKQGTRLAAGTRGRRTWIDGPFTECKELVAGFAVIRANSKQEAIAWANRYAAILGDEIEVDLRELASVAGP